MEAILGTIVGFIAFGIIWFFLLRPKNDQTSSAELKIKEEELKKSQIDLATREAEIKACQLFQHIDLDNIKFLPFHILR